ncbi:TPA: helix-turn-helix transcriptional regulator [Escherichia coli]|nr:helix-turn-helix transcriptional regulator [Escherichia coli]
MNINEMFHIHNAFNNLNNFSLVGYKPYNTVLLFTNNNSFVLRNKNGSKYTLSDNTLAILGKNESWDIFTFNPPSNDSCDGLPFMATYLSDEVVHRLKDIFTSVNHGDFDKKTYSPIYSSLIIKDDAENVRNLLKDINSNYKNIVELGFRLSKMSDLASIHGFLIKQVRNSTYNTVISIVESNISKKLTLEDVSKALNMSDTCLRKRLLSEGLTFKKIQTDIKMKHAGKLIRTSNLQVSQVARELGFSSVPYFTKIFREHYGKSPKKYLKLFTNN